MVVVVVVGAIKYKCYTSVSCHNTAEKKMCHAAVKEDDGSGAALYLCVIVSWQ